MIYLLSLASVYRAFWLVAIFSLAGCGSSASPDDESSSLQSVADNELVLRLAPYKNDPTQLVFKVCSDSQDAGNCILAFLNSSQEPVVFSPEEVADVQNHEIASLGELVKQNPGITTTVALAASSPAVVYYLNPVTSSRQAALLKELKAAGLASVNGGYELIKAREDVLAPLVSYRFEEGKITIQPPAKLEALLHSQGKDIDYPHIFKQDFVSFFKNKYAAELKAHGVSAEKVLNFPFAHQNSLGFRGEPQIDFDEVVKEYRLKIHGNSLHLGSYNNPVVYYNDMIRDLIHPSVLKEFQAYNNILQPLTRDAPIPIYAASQESRKHNKLEHLRKKDKPNYFKDFLGSDRWKYPEISTMMGTSDPSNLVTPEIFTDPLKPGMAAEAIHRIHEFALLLDPYLSPHALSSLEQEITQKIILPKQQLENAFPKTSQRSILTANQWRFSLKSKAAALFAVVVTGLAAGGIAKVLGIGVDKESDQNVLLTYPSLLQAATDSTSVDSVPAIVDKLGNHLAKTGIDIQYYCLPSGCSKL